MSIATFNKTCASHTPGNQQLILIATVDVESITMADGEITVITQDTANDAVVVPIDRDGMARMEEQTATKGGLLYVVQKLEVELSKSSKDLQDFIKSVADRRNIRNCNSCNFQQRVVHGIGKLHFRQGT